MRLKPSPDNTHFPRFSNNTALFFHRLGNGLVWTCHWGFDQLMRFSDPIIDGRSNEMDQFAKPIEVVAKIFRLVFGLTAFVTGSPLALLGQLIKVPTAYFAKQNYEYYAYDDRPDHIPDLPEHDIQIKTWNLAAMHSGLRRMNGTRPVSPRINEIIKHILSKDDDILCFQEVFTEKAMQMLVEGLRHQYPYIVHNVGKNILGVNSGLMMFSKYPMDHLEFETFNTREGFNALAQKGVLGAIITLANNKKMVVTNAHLDAGGTTNPRNSGHANKFAQMAQVFTLRDKLEATAKEHNEKIISVFAADANLNAKKLVANQHEPVIHRLLTQYKIDAAETRKTTLNTRILDKDQAQNKALDNGKSGGDLIKARIQNNADDTTPYLSADQQVYIAEHKDTLDASDHFPSTLRVTF